MVNVRIDRLFLERRNACQRGLDFFDSLPEESLAAGEWSDAHYLWLAVNLPDFLAWLRAYGRVGPANLAGIDLRNVDLTGAELRGADLSGADLRGTNLPTARVARANLTDALADEAPDGWTLIDGRLAPTV